MNEVLSSKEGNCRRPIVCGRPGRYFAAGGLEMRWHELRRYATIEKDSENLLRLIAEFEKRQRQAQADVKRDAS
jgi:hypothetical protein